VISGNFRNLDPLITNESCEEIIFNPLINIFDPKELSQVIVNWKNKLVKGGILSLTFINFPSVGLDAYLGKLSLPDTHKLTIGQYNEFRSIIDVNNLSNFASV